MKKGKTLEEELLAFERMCYEPFYQKVVEGFIFESEDLYDTLEFFERVNDTKKSDFIADVLNKYYEGYVQKKMNELIKEEKYEECNRIKRFVKIVTY